MSEYRKVPITLLEEILINWWAEDDKNEENLEETRELFKSNDRDMFDEALEKYFDEVNDYLKENYEMEI